MESLAPAPSLPLVASLVGRVSVKENSRDKSPPTHTHRCRVLVATVYCVLLFIGSPWSLLADNSRAH